LSCVPIDGVEDGVCACDDKQNESPRPMRAVMRLFILELQLTGYPKMSAFWAILLCMLNISLKVKALPRPVCLSA